MMTDVFHKIKEDRRNNYKKDLEDLLVRRDNAKELIRTLENKIKFTKILIKNNEKRKTAKDRQSE